MKTLTKKTIQFDQLMKVFKKFVSTESYRPVLQLVKFDGKYFTATNSHIILRVNAEYVTDFPENLNDEFLYDPKENTVKQMQNNYPETDRIIEQGFYTDSAITLNNNNIKELHKAVKEAKRAAKTNKTIELNFKPSYLEVTGECLLTKEFKSLYGKNYKDKFKEISEREQEEITPSEYKTKLEEIASNGDKVNLLLSKSYIDTALTTVKKLSKLSKDQVNLHIDNGLRPVTFKQENVFDLLVMPVRNK
ncbi:hypothetical protein [Bacillus infantis]|uniref:hypothetical protein n=1 Tax=Bacillus infantis TaxID=324767 RepID=UPI00209DD5AF|nr:hypothetical protein [Bacillus infantis]MCP1159400.1 hypothetical protein [Bacillus infantis]